MFLVMGITGKVGGATATHLLTQGKKVRALVRDRAKAASWTDQGVELVGGDWNDAASIERALEGCRWRVCHVASHLGSLAGFHRKPSASSRTMSRRSPKRRYRGSSHFRRWARTEPAGWD
jgi:uncharacterized protein YbjT (DUF2867 family)